MFTMRPVRPSDLDLVCFHRERMFREAGVDDGVLLTMAQPFRQWLRPRLVDGRYFGWVVERAGADVVAGLGMTVIEWPPHPAHPTQQARGYILNVFVEPACRRAGLATRLMKIAQEEAGHRGLSLLVLHATDLGRSVYGRLGWEATAEMALSIAL
jgi:ribosomal protein S18 acetylase RimI-like enzyme